MVDAVYHPNVLAAITAARIRGKEIETERTSTIIERINTETPQYTRFVRLLDALAALAVSDPDGQVVAISLQELPDSITLTVAQNDTVPEELIRHLNALVTRLKEYSKLDVTNEKGREAQKLAIMKLAYIHSDLKISRRFAKRKWLGELETVLEHRAEGLGDAGPLCLELVSSLLRIKDTFDYIHSWKTIKNNRSSKYGKMTPAKQVTDEDWGKLILLMDGSMEDIQRLLADTDSFSLLAQKLQGTTALLD